MTEKAPKDFEQQVQRIFSALEDNSTRVEWNVKMRDPDTGQARQIDVRIVREDGPIIHVECRDKKRPQDVMWIEELIGRRESLGADAVIAVSASGFSGPALAKAKAKGVLTRQLSKIDPKDLQIIVDQPEIWVPIAENVSFAVEFTAPLHKHGHVSAVYKEHKRDFLNEVMQSVITYITIEHIYGKPDDKRSPVEHTFTSKVTAQGLDLSFRATIRFETNWQKLRIKTKSFSRRDGSAVSIEAEVHSGDVHGVLAEIVITENIWSIIVDFSRAVFPRGSAVSTNLFFGNKYMGGKQMKFDVRLFDGKTFMFQASDRLVFAIA